MSSEPASSFETSLDIPGAICAISRTLDVNEIIKSVGSDSHGANVYFIGTTRDNFEGKNVTRLEYQAYSKLAIKTMTEIVRTAQASGPQDSDGSPSLKCAVHHRIGVVPVGEPSIVIAVSAPHRKEAFVACEYILEEVKRKAQIWKREHYDGEDEAEWKANKS
ncbi:hypothetical protein VNI00_001628 [Paramarasmius palmivorus]|uniref:Molybdenum cofactor synthesis 2 n=1 Tax=Paramarasmius palmivorus TaxID=297713 RepID=A0AAW0E4H7_9AGAR